MHDGWIVFNHVGFNRKHLFSPKNCRYHSPFGWFIIMRFNAVASCNGYFGSNVVRLDKDMPMLEKNLNALLVIAISCVLFGAFGIQFLLHEVPCPLCLLQRLAMIGLATGALLNLKFGIRKAHYGLSILSCVFGGFVALRHILLHICPQFPKFGHPFWGLSLYVWSFILFASSITYIGLLLLIFDRQIESYEPKPLNWWCLLAFILIFVADFANIFTTFFLCGWGACE